MRHKDLNLSATVLDMTSQLATQLSETVVKLTKCCSHNATFVVAQAFIAMGVCMLQTLNEEKPCKTIHDEQTDHAAARKLVDDYWSTAARKVAPDAETESVH